MEDVVRHCDCSSHFALQSFNGQSCFVPDMVEKDIVCQILAVLCNSSTFIACSSAVRHTVLTLFPSVISNNGKKW